jgi:hypothetical protein
MERLSDTRAAPRAAQPISQAVERELRAVALAQRHEVELAAVPADVAVRVEAFALSEIADRSDSNGSLARSSAAVIHGTDIPDLFFAL